MSVDLAETVWRGMRMGHPGDWEAIRLSSPGARHRCIFADRRHQRMEVLWRPLTHVPKLELMLEKYRARYDKKDRLEKLDTAPEEWLGLKRKGPDGTIVHAGRFFRDERRLVEVTLVWPKGRSVALENAVLTALAPVAAAGGVTTWQANGISADVPEAFTLRTSSAKVGRVRWDFDTAGKKGPELTIERLAMPGAWLQEALRDWLLEEVPDKHRVVRQGLETVQSHRREELVSSAGAGKLKALRGIKRVRLDVAWVCPGEDRLYHVALTRVGRDEDLSLPEGLVVRCCRGAPVVTASDGKK